jgi:hypothetical protein
MNGGPIEAVDGKEKVYSNWFSSSFGLGFRSMWYLGKGEIS